MKFLKPIILLTLLLTCQTSLAGLVINNTGYYFSKSGKDNGSTKAMSTYHDRLFVGATFLKSKRMALGWNYHMWNESDKDTNTDTYASTEMGPRLLWFWNSDHTVFLSATWSPFLSATRTIGGASEEELGGSSIHVSFSGQFKLGGAWALGVSMNYHSASFTTSKVGTTESTITDSRTHIYPAIELSVRFK